MSDPVVLKSGFVSWLVGPSAILHALFSTIGVRLEPEGWGSRFPHLMNELYMGELDPAHAAAARAELETVTAELRELPPSDVVWDAEDRSAEPPWGADLPDRITDLSNYFLTVDGANLVEMLAAAIEHAGQFERPLKVTTQFARA